MPRGCFTGREEIKSRSSLEASSGVAAKMEAEEIGLDLGVVSESC